MTTQHRCESAPVRRVVLWRLAHLGGVTALLTAAAAIERVVGAATPALAQPAGPGRDAHMRQALEMRRRAVEQGDQPFGAVVVKDERIVGEGISAVVTAGDPTAHAEMQAIRDACRRLGTRDLGGCELYSTSRPCRMCETAGYWARIDRMFFGAAISDGGRPQYGTC